MKAPHPNTYWTPERIVAAAKAWGEIHGRAPAADEWRAATPERPSTRTAIQMFGSWNAFVAAAGFETRRANRPGRWTREQVVSALFQWTFEHGRLPRSYDWWPPSEDRPSARQVMCLFGSWNAAIVAAGYRPTVSYRTLDGYQRQAGYRQRVLDGTAPDRWAA